MNKVREFSNEVLGNVRVVLIDGVSWFVANDVCKALGYTASRNAIHDHVSVEYRKALKYKACIETMRAELWGENDYMDKVLLTEAGMWQLVFGSKLDKALEFQKWIYSVVLPSLHENGGYIVGQENLDPADLDALKTDLKKMHQEVQEKTRKIEHQKEWIDELEYELNASRAEVHRLNERFDRMDRDGVYDIY